LPSGGNVGRVLRWGFYQIELEPGSRDITAFATDDGIFWYKRLSFGVNATPKKCQHIITHSMAGLKGVANNLQMILLCMDVIWGNMIKI